MLAKQPGWHRFSSGVVQVGEETSATGSLECVMSSSTYSSGTGKIKQYIVVIEFEFAAKEP